MSNRRDIQFLYNPHNKATLLDVSFDIASTDANGTGVINLNGSGRIASVFMNTSPATTTVRSVFASGVQVVTLASTTGVYVGQGVTDSTTGGNITAGTTVLAVNSDLNQVTLSKVTAGASASSPGDNLAFVFATAAPGNPNPAAGIIIVNLQDNYNRYLGAFASIESPVSGTPISISGSSVMTVGNPYMIQTLGTSTQANWVAVGVPSFVTAAVGVSFIASVTGGGTGTGTVEAPKSTFSGLDHIEVMGKPGLMNSNGASAQVLGGGQGMQLMFACLYQRALTAPSDLSRIKIAIYLNNSAQGV